MIHRLLPAIRYLIWGTIPWETARTIAELRYCLNLQSQRIIHDEQVIRILEQGPQR